MNRFGLVSVIGASFVLAACGSASAANGGSSPSPGANAAARGGAAGQLVQINGDTLILSSANGDITVTFSSSTPITKASTASLADITAGVCIVAMGPKDSSGSITATTVRLSPKGANGCAAPGGGFNPDAGGSPRPSPSGSPRPSPSGQPNNLTVLTGEVTAVSGTSITVKTAAGASQMLIVPTVATVSISSTTTAAALQVGQCLRATGTPDASGNVQATALTITPPGANGTCATGRQGLGRPPGA